LHIDIAVFALICNVECKHLVVCAFTGACLELSRTTSTAKFFPALAVLPSWFCLCVHLAVCAISTTQTSVLPEQFVCFTRSCKTVFDVFETNVRLRTSVVVDDRVMHFLLVFLV